MTMNALQKELVRTGLAQEPKEKKKRYHKKFKCHKCGASMCQIPDTNTMACEQCGQYFIFNR